MAASSSSSSCKYDVFLSFRGEDTRKNFVCHLYRALKQKLIFTFIDSEDLQKGNKILELLNAIEDSKLSIVVLSENYASSSWCLEELVKILDCKNQRVLPIYYQVDPDDIRYLKGKFGEAFANKFGEADEQELASWRSALEKVVDLSGWDSRNYPDDIKLIEKIVEDTLKLLTSSEVKYDVYLSFTELDTRSKIFVSHLYNALERKSISTFIVTERFRRGDRVVRKAVDESMLSVVVFSENYASSKGCIMELVKIMKCNQIVLPVFYEVQRVVVRDQKESFGQAFNKHKLLFRETEEELKRWRSALTRAANLPGSWDSSTYQTNEAKLVEDIAEDILKKLIKLKRSSPVNRSNVNSSD